ncbi:PTS system mannose-specific EIID component [Serratia rubidaea]|uniref:PTS system mannose-specific EIID component n=1 Tax=Serratia rubidaea TaxID=61652 RepID=A0A4U9HKL6_SERRU|nr:PTS system mannose-specific EIID component [Serratia rubidaea]
MVDTTTAQKKLTPADVRGVFIRSNLFQGSWNFERMQALGFCFSMVPAIRRLYPENNDQRKQAIKRHLEFFNTHPYVAAPILGSRWRWKNSALTAPLSMTPPSTASRSG